MKRLNDLEEEITARAVVRQVRIAPRKMRPTVRWIVGKSAEEAVLGLMYQSTKASKIVLRALNSAVSNAREKGLDVDQLVVKRAWVDEGIKMIRYLPRAQGRATKIRKRASHLTVVVGY